MKFGTEALAKTPVVHCGFKLSNTYLIVQDKIAVVDLGLPSEASKVVQFVKNKLNRDPADISLIVATHFHVDHIAGIPELKAATGAFLTMHQKAGARIHRGVPVDGFSTSRVLLGGFPMWVGLGLPFPGLRDLLRMPRAGIPGKVRLFPTSVDMYLGDGDHLPGFPEWSVVHTPGHTLDSICLYHEGSQVLITGDTIVEKGGKHYLTPLIHRDRLPLAYRSFSKLSKLDVSVICPGHGRPTASETPLSHVLDICAPLAFLGF